MTELVVLLSTGKGTWAEVAKVINSYEWEKIYIITNEFGYNTFKKKENTEIILLNFEEDIEILSKKILEKIKDKIIGPEIALNISSGTGKEHMALMSALMKSGLGFRLVSANEKGLIEL